MIVVDTNVIAYRFLDVALSPLADNLAAKDAHWHAPVLWRSEFRNVLVGEMRRRDLSLAHAGRAMISAEKFIRGHSVSNERVLALAQASHCGAYDLEFVALAETLEVPLYTMDRQILTAFPELARPLMPA